MKRIATACLLLAEIALCGAQTKKDDRAEYLAAFERLGREYSLDRVAREHMEPGWKDLQGGATPLSQLVRVQERYHPSHVYVQADMSIALDLAIGLGLRGRVAG